MAEAPVVVRRRGQGRRQTTLAALRQEARQARERADQARTRAADLEARRAGAGWIGRMRMRDQVAQAHAEASRAEQAARAAQARVERIDRDLRSQEQVQARAEALAAERIRDRRADYADELARWQVWQEAAAEVEAAADRLERPIDSAAPRPDPDDDTADLLDFDAPGPRPPGL